MARPDLLAAAVFAFAFRWTDVLSARVLTRTGVTTCTVQVRQCSGGPLTFRARRAAISVPGTIPETR